MAVERSCSVRCSSSDLWSWPFYLVAFVTWLWAGLTAGEECCPTSGAQGTATAGTSPVTAAACEQASYTERGGIHQHTMAAYSSLVPGCMEAPQAALVPCSEKPNREERNFCPAVHACPLAIDSESPADPASPLGCCTELVAWGPYYPWRYRPRWVYPYRYYPLRWSYSIYSPYYFYSPYVRWPAAPTWGYRGYMAFGWGQPWYAPWAWGSGVTPYDLGWTGFGVGACCGGLCSRGTCYGCGALLPYDTGPYFGWPYDVGRSFATPWAGLSGPCYAPRFAPCCPPGCIDASGDLHW